MATGEYYYLDKEKNGEREIYHSCVYLLGHEQTRTPIPTTGDGKGEALRPHVDYYIRIYAWFLFCQWNEIEQTVRFPLFYRLPLICPTTPLSLPPSQYEPSNT